MRAPRSSTPPPPRLPQSQLYFGDRTPKCLPAEETGKRESSSEVPDTTSPTPATEQHKGLFSLLGAYLDHATLMGGHW